MSSWASGPFLGFDTETTGVDPSSDRIVTAALVHRDSHGTAVRTWIIDPGVEIPDGAAAIHGVTTEKARADGVPPAEALEEIATLITGAQLEGVPLVAYNVCFDLTILETELARHGLPTLVDRLGRGCLPVIDPLVIDRGAVKFRKGKRRLGDLCIAYGIAEQTDLHSADVDVAATLDVLAEMAATHPAIGRMDLEELHAWQIEAHRAWAESFNAWRQGKGLEGPGADLGWPMLSTATVRV